MADIISNFLSLVGWADWSTTAELINNIVRLGIGCGLFALIVRGIFKLAGIRNML